VLRLTLAVCVGDDSRQLLSPDVFARTDHDGFVFLFGVGLMAGAALVAGGGLTPIVPLVVAVMALRSRVDGFAAPLLLASASVWQLVVLEVGLALGLALIGPGAYSIDARLFGRREITIYARPRSVHQSRDKAEGDSAKGGSSL
jgi:hypothetical protein